ncbi:alpha/beta hydrolase [Actinosynnema sp. ALI-1.44]|uniref:alpha/beta fold hydrolase n=1 Tax=Actinosynnema sp. ALI-1.44 TaxID=1933779 RepID=UPI00097BBA9F|nr:alpha/beta hydrolase [Actinosynnema sp. ALI-1.44]ONI86364.1 alpha/beta hydrolase [Actinosynnema sp. ALI-1.44]
MNDAQLAESLGFRSEYADVNGTRLHYVIGGEGKPVVLLGGWPHTWWEFHKVMPPLAEHYRVVVVDIRGMNLSAKPESGYDKKTMARDIHELVRHLGFDRVDLVGHDIGAMVAFSFAANHPDAIDKLVMVDVPHPDEDLYDLTLLPKPGQALHLWWFAFNQLTALPQVLLAGNVRALVDHLSDLMLLDPANIDEKAREIYAKAYDSPDAIRASNGWYQTFGQDAVDMKSYAPLTLPVLALTSRPADEDYAVKSLRKSVVDPRFEPIPGTGHYIPEEQPEAMVAAIRKFLG